MTSAKDSGDFMVTQVPALRCLTHKVNLNTGSQYFPVWLGPVQESRPLHTEEGTTIDPEYGIGSAYTWSLFTVPQIVLCTRRSVPQHEAI